MSIKVSKLLPLFTGVWIATLPVKNRVGITQNRKKYLKFVVVPLTRMRNADVDKPLMGK